jgi:signal transduction histidine kinase
MECRPNIENTPLFEVMKKCIRFRESASIEEKLTYTDGNVRFFELVIEPVPQGILILSLDVTEKYKLKKSRANYISLISQELRTPLTSLKWNLELFSKDPSLPQEKASHLKELLALNTNLLKTAENLLQVSQTETSKQSFCKKHSSLSNLINLSLKILKEQGEISSNFIKLTLPKRKTPIFVDPCLFARSFENIFFEALEHGGPAADISIRAVKKFGYYEVIISCRKCPLSKENKVSVLCPKNLRLFIAKAAAEGNGGKVWFEEDGKRGINFFMSVPLVEY